MNEDIGSVASELASLLRNSVSRACDSSKIVGVLFSGGIDSSIVAILASEFAKVNLYCVGVEGAEDVRFSTELSERLDLPLRTFTFTLDDAKKAVAELSGKIVGKDRMQLGIALPVYFATRLAMKDGLEFALSGGGADELYGGYARYLKVPTAELNEVLRLDVAAMRDKDLRRDSAASSIEVRYPFLDRAVVDFSLLIKGDMKVSGGNRKIVLREVGRQLGLPAEITERKKKACQYGSGADRLVGRILKRSL